MKWSIFYCIIVLVSFKAISYKKGQVNYSYKSLLIAMSTCILILLAFVLIHILVRSDFQTLFPIYMTIGPFLAIIEIGSLVSLMKIITDTNKITSSSNVNQKSSAIRAIKQFLYYPKGLANILVTLIVIISIFLSNYATTSTSIYVEQKTNISGEKLLSSLHVHHENWKNHSNYNARPLKPVLLHNLKAFNKRISNNAVHKKNTFNGINNLIHHDASRRDANDALHSNFTSKIDSNNRNIPPSFLALIQNSRKSLQTLADQKRHLLKTVTFINSNTPFMHEKSHVAMPNIIKTDNELKVVNKTSTTSSSANNRHLNLETQFNLSTTSKNISWHHVLPIWKKVMHNLATKMETNENKEEGTQKNAVIKTWKNTLVGILAIILFASLFLQLSLLITTFTTKPVSNKYKFIFQCIYSILFQCKLFFEFLITR